jgi:hypothetical protein
LADLAVPHVVSPGISNHDQTGFGRLAIIYSTQTDVKQGNRWTNVNGRDATEVGAPGGIIRSVSFFS